MFMKLFLLKLCIGLYPAGLLYRIF